MTTFLICVFLFIGIPLLTGKCIAFGMGDDE